jgi:hypothetical protein
VRRRALRWAASPVAASVPRALCARPAERAVRCLARRGRPASRGIACQPQPGALKTVRESSHEAMASRAVHEQATDQLCFEQVRHSATRRSGRLSGMIKRTNDTSASCAGDLIVLRSVRDHAAQAAAAPIGGSVRPQKSRIVTPRDAQPWWAGRSMARCSIHYLRRRPHPRSSSRNRSRPSLYHGPPGSPCNRRMGPEQARHWLALAAIGHGKPSLAAFCPPKCPPEMISRWSARSHEDRRPKYGRFSIPSHAC